MMSTTQKVPADERYLSWLCGLIAYDERRKDSKIRNSVPMIRGLFDESFRYFIPNDDNRADEGQCLRIIYIETTQNRLEPPFYFRDCSVLEMMIALSERMAFQIFNPMKEQEPDAPSCFWEIIDNLKLKPNQSNVAIIHKLNTREYMESGLGGMFPLNDPREDQRTIEIWYQMMAYINEHY